MSNEESVFSFDLNESLFFEKGQEVEEVVGISLDPEISIQPFHDYISIRGVVELQGSYIRANLDQSDEKEESFLSDGYQTKRYMDRVINTEDNEAEFTHRFPVEISVPTNRVNDLNDVSVMITEFDYELLERNQLQLKSTIQITGINDQIVPSPTREPVYDQEENILDDLEREEESFEFEMTEEKESVDFSNDPLEDMENLPTLPDENSFGTDHEEQEEELEQSRWKYNKKSQSLSEFFNKDQGKEWSEDSSSSDSSDESSGDYDESSSSMEFIESDDSRNEEVTDVRFLSSLFRGEDDDEQESYTKMRLCIVQQEDTLETIAERYETTTLQITSQNNLDNEDIKEGQILYIPNRK